ncbi:hypothetical protein BJV74DRAFT_862126 [Russula compacta]|nr:hypothetical protein BJV74DRAFT_862126 [Russula compacta]
MTSYLEGKLMALAISWAAAVATLTLDDYHPFDPFILIINISRYFFVSTGIAPFTFVEMKMAQAAWSFAQPSGVR